MEILPYKGHEFVAVSFHAPTSCEACNKSIWAMFKPPPALVCRRKFFRWLPTPTGSWIRLNRSCSFRMSYQNSSGAFRKGRRYRHAVQRYKFLNVRFCFVNVHCFFVTVNIDNMLAREIMVIASSSDECKQWVHRLKKRIPPAVDRPTALLTSRMHLYLLRK